MPTQYRRIDESCIYHIQVGGKNMIFIHFNSHKLVNFRAYPIVELRPNETLFFLIIAKLFQSHVKGILKNWTAYTQICIRTLSSSILYYFGMQWIIANDTIEKNLLDFDWIKYPSIFSIAFKAIQTALVTIFAVTFGKFNYN